MRFVRMNYLSILVSAAFLLATAAFAQPPAPNTPAGPRVYNPYYPNGIIPYYTVPMYANGPFYPYGMPYSYSFPVLPAPSNPSGPPAPPAGSPAGCGDVPYSAWTDIQTQQAGQAPQPQMTCGCNCPNR